MNRTRLLALALAVSLPAVARAQNRDFEGFEVKEVKFEGLSRVSEFAMKAHIDTKPGDKLSHDVLSKDVEHLYRTGEFESADDRSPPVDVNVVADPANPKVACIVVFHVRERQPVRKVKFTNADELKRSELDDVVKTKPKGLFDRYRLQQDKKEIQAKLVEKGFLYADVDAKATDTGGAGIDVEFILRPGPKVFVEEIVFEGAHDLDPGVVKDAEGANALETKERKWFGLAESGSFDRRALRRDLDRIARYYRSMGYLDARVYLDRYESSDDRTKLKIHVRVEEGERYNVRSVSVVGAHVIETDAILKELKLQPGRAFLGEDLRTDIDKIKRMYGDRAYIHAEVDVDVQYDVKRKLLDLTYRVNEGVKVRIDRIKVEGNDKTREEIVRRELIFYPGEYFDATKIEKSLNNLGRLRYFKDVRIDFEPGTETGREDLVLKIEEARTGSFTLGGGISTNAGLFGNISLTQRNFDITNFPTSWRDIIDGHAFTGAGQTFSIQLQPGNQRSQYRVSFVEPWLGGYPIPFQVDAFIFDRQREDWLEQRYGGTLSLGYRFVEAQTTVRATYRFEQVNVVDLKFNAVPDAIAVAGVNYVSAVKLAITYDNNKIDRYSLLYDGESATFSYEFAGLGGNAHYSRLTLEANIQRTLFEWPSDYKWVIQGYGLGGIMFPIDGPTPIYERFFAGGPQSMRGFAYRGVGPMANDNPRGGDLVTTGTVEFSYPIFQHILRGVFFTDFGFLNLTSALPTSVIWRQSLGFGFRISLPIFPAPIALDFGWPIIAGHSDQRQVFSFSVGFGF
jgi:outer membrane protein insertion porin family